MLEIYLALGALGAPPKYSAAELMLAKKQSLLAAAIPPAAA